MKVLFLVTSEQLRTNIKKFAPSLFPKLKVLVVRMNTALIAAQKNPDIEAVMMSSQIPGFQEIRKNVMSVLRKGTVFADTVSYQDNPRDILSAVQSVLLFFNKG